MYCAECGKEIPEDSEFCGYCGATTSAAPAGGTPAAAASPQGPPPPPPPPPTYAPPPPGGAAPPSGTGAPPLQYGSTPPKKSAMPWVLGVLGLLVVGGIVVVLLLGFAVGPKWFVGKDKGGGAEAGGPEETVADFFKSWEKRDAKMLLGTMEPDFVESIKDALGADYIDLIDEYFFEYFPEDLRIDIEEMDSKVTGDRAEVKIVEGTMTYTDEYGDRITEKASEADLDVFELVRVDGKWYLSEDTLIDMGFDFSGIGDLQDMEDMDFEDGEYSLVDLPVDSEDEVLTLLFEEEEIWDWYLNTDLPQYDISEESDRWVAYLYELDADGNEIPFAWYEVDKESGEVFMITNE